jgi:hypothetical protein
MNETELETVLRATRAANPGDSHTSHMQEAWLLIALGRAGEGLAAARRAQEVWAMNHAKVRAPYGGAIYWDPWIAEAAVALAQRNWSHAEHCALRVLKDFSEEQSAGVLLELALQAQGRLHPERVLCFSRDPARELAAFDLRAYAAKRARLI